MFGLLLPLNIQVASAAIMSWLGQALLFGTALAVLTWLMIHLFRRRGHPTFEVAVWSIVLLKFVIPLGPASSFSLVSVFEGLKGYAPASLVTGDVSMPQTRSPGSVGESSALTGSAAASEVADWRTPAAAAYLVTVLALLAVRVWGYRRLAARCRSLPAADDATHEIVAGVCRRFRLRRVPSVRIDTESSTTFMIGLFQTLIVISGRQLARPSELETVIVHEVAHLKRGDMFVRCLQWFVSTLLFFWPVVAWVNRRIDEARETACDDWALRHGKLTAREYARCLLNAIQPMRMAPLAYHPPCMAGHPSTIERRINMVLNSPDCLATRRIWGLSTVALVLAWGGFALTGGVDAGPKHGVAEKEWAPTEEAFKVHFAEVMDQVGEYEAADLDANGELSYWEKTAFVTTLALTQANALMEAYPYADVNDDGELDITEACDFVRGLTLVRGIEEQAKLDHMAAVESGEDKKMAGKILKTRVHEERLAAFHEALDAQQWLLAGMAAVPSAEDLEMNNSFIVGTFAEKEKQRQKYVDQKKIAELEAKIADIRAQLAGETDEERAAKLEEILKKLEAKTDAIKVKPVKGEDTQPARKRTKTG